ncbi:TonB-dependent receptor [Altererythrobacter lauratis]|uniref:TonB-dependent receptor n=1 Tax=Alteraurantiacibacter lauratis TaxID=2054627 RepID=A0ABV7EJH0_9SPHN
MAHTNVAFVGRSTGANEIRKTRNLLRAGASAAVLGGMLLSGGAMAQDAAPVAAEASSDVILVTGIRQSLANAQNIKRDSDTVVDAITAEDIGALPDRSVTEALQRVPGIAINRFAGSNDPDHFSVEGSGVVIRGLNFVRSEFNGRTAFAAGVGGQALNFADVPSELLGSVVISKNATADMIEGGLAGTVNLVTRKPLDRGGFQIAFGAEANYGDMAKEWTPTLSGLISNTWETDAGTFGILVSGSYSQIKSRADGLQITNFQTRDGRLVNAANAGGTQVCRNPLPGDTDTTTLPPPGSACGAAGAAGADGFADYAGTRYAPLGGQFRTQEFNRQRDGFSVSAQYETPDGGTRVTAEFIRSHTTNAWGEYTYETAPDLSEYSTFPIGCQQNQNGPNRVNADGSLGDPTPRAQCPVGGFTDFEYDANGLFQSGYIVNASNGWRGPVHDGRSNFVPVGGLQQSLARRQVLDETTNMDASFNVRSQLTDRLHASLDLQYAHSQKDNLDVSVFGSIFADQELDLTGRYPVVTPRKPQFLGYTWSQPSAVLRDATEAEYFSDPRFQFWRAAMDHIEDSTGSQYAMQADLAYDISDDAFIRRVKVGARYQDRQQDIRYSTYNWGMLSETWTGDRPINFADTPQSASAYYDFPNFFRGNAPGPLGGFYYTGDLIKDYAGSVNFFRSIQAQARALGANPSWNPLAERNVGTENAADADGYIPDDKQPVYQQDAAGYIMFNFASDNFLGSRLAGNFGVRYVRSDIRSDGRVGVPTQQALNIVDPYDVRCAIEEVPDGAPPGTEPSRPGGVCLRGPTGYAALQQFANGQGRADIAQFEYDYWLPSFNARFEAADDVILRFAASKVLTRPDNAYIRNFLTIGLDQSGNLTANAGNPFLKPATAWQFDLTAEWYFDTVGSLTGNLFYKRVKNFFFQDVTQRAITNNGVTENVFVRGPANFDGSGEIKGFEIAYQQTFDFLPGLLSGLGTSANYTFIKSSGLPNTFLNGGNLPNNSTVPPGNLPLEQLSKHNANVTVFYESGPLSMRAAYNWRSRFLLTASDVIFPYFSIFNEPTGQLDASIFYAILPNVRIGVQGVNLTNEVTRTTQAYTGNPDQLAPRSYFMNDRRFSFILRGQF